MAITDPIFAIKIGAKETPGNKCKRLSEIIMLHREKSKEFPLACMNMVKEIHQVMKSHDLHKNEALERFWNEIHKIIVTKVSKDLWKNFFLELNCDEFNERSITFQMLFQFIVMNIVQQILKSDVKNEAEEAVDVELTIQEQEVLSYVAGFVIFSLLKKYKKLSSSSKYGIEAGVAIQFLNGLRSVDNDKVHCHSFLDFTTKWVDLVNRGGLVKINHEMFIFVRRIENVVRRKLNLNLIKTYRGQDIRVIIEKELQNSSFISSGWDSVSRMLPNRQLAHVLMNQIIEKWVDIRARSFVDSYIQLVKRSIAKNKVDSNIKLSKKGEQSMRKKLT